MFSKRNEEKLQQMKVFVRTRPLSTQEKEGRETSCIEITGPKELSVRQQPSRKYVFDQVFAPHFKQVDVYKAVVHPLISEVLTGYNCTVFAYGQTGSGKTHTMIGNSRSDFDVPWQDNDSSGIIPRAMANLFEDLQLTQQQHTVRISYIELYNEEVYDLLAENDDNDRIRLFEDQQQKGSVIIQGIEQVTVENNKDVKKILDKGQDKRRTAATLMNSQSSRSHTVFTITVVTHETTEGDIVLEKTGKLNLVDLAGTEDISRSGAVEKRAREAGNINQSLLTLGRVIKSLSDNSGHIPYSESKLTRILQDSLGGRTKTSIIATISTATCNVVETLSTLEYAKRAQTIKNRPEINQRMSQKAEMDQCLEELEKCRRDLQGSRSGTGVYLAQENYEQLIADNDNNKQELSVKIQHIRDLTKNLNEVNASFEKTKEELDACRERLLQIENEKNRQEFLANRYEEKAEQLYNEVQSLVTSVKTSKNIDAALREKIEKLYSTANENRVSLKQMSNIVKNKFEDMCDDVVNYKENCKVNDNRMLSMLKSIQDKHSDYFDTNEAFMDYILCHWRTYAIAHQAFAENSKTELEIWMKQFVTSCKYHATEIKKQRDEEKLLIKKLQVVVENTNTQQSQTVCNMKSQLENGHRITTNMCHSFEEEFGNYTNDLLTEVSKLTVSTKMQFDQKVMEEQLALGQETIKNLQNSIEFLRSNYVMLQSNCKASKEETSSNLSTLNKLESEITDMRAFIKDWSFNQLLTHNDESFSLLMKPLDNFEKIQVSGKSTQTKLLENLKDERLEEAFVENVEMQNDVFLEKNETIFNGNILQLATHGNELTNHAVQETSQVKNKALELTVNFAEVPHVVQVMVDSRSRFENQLTQNLSDCIDRVTNFTNVKYKEIIPSGDTPIRMQYHCHNLNPLTPKENILGRFQERLRVME